MFEVRIDTGGHSCYKDSKGQGSRNNIRRGRDARRGGSAFFIDSNVGLKGKNRRNNVSNFIEKVLLSRRGFYERWTSSISSADFGCYGNCRVFGRI
jgi:hypothetical protein